MEKINLRNRYLGLDSAARYSLFLENDNASGMDSAEWHPGMGDLNQQSSIGYQQIV